MQEELKKQLEDMANAKGWDVNEFIMEELVYSKSLKEYGHDEHRWYTMYSKVVKIGDIYIDFQTYTNSGDEAAFDGEEHLKMVMESACEVFPQAVIVTDYVTADKLSGCEMEKPVEVKNE